MEIKMLNRTIWKTLSIQMKEDQCLSQSITLEELQAPFKMIFNRKLSKRFRQTLTIQTNSEIKFTKMITSKQIKKVQANLHINISKIHPGKLFNLLKRLIKT